jgi:hypothetical protein
MRWTGISAFDPEVTAGTAVISCRLLAVQAIRHPHAVGTMRVSSKPDFSNRSRIHRVSAPAVYRVQHNSSGRAHTDAIEPNRTLHGQGRNCGILGQTRLDGSMKRPAQLPLLLVPSVVMFCDCTRI